ncbi:MAG: hypothetical protein IJS22_04930 [Lachnospiraceae bacterium]|nr:hypothetical protein [Lachnospiraceae bacterium]
MKEKISRISRGQIDPEMPQVSISPLSIEAVIPGEDVFKAEFRISGEDRFFLRSLIYSTNQRVKSASPYFAGSNIYISYSVDTARLPAGSTVSGEFQLVTCGGEFVVPYTFTVKKASLAIGDIKEGDELPSRITRAELMSELAEEKRAAAAAKNDVQSHEIQAEADRSETDKDFYLKLLSGDHDSNIYQSFEHQMRGYVRDEILAGHLDEKLARIYSQVLEPSMIDETLAKALPDIIFAHRIEVPSRFRRLEIEYDEMEGSQQVSLQDGKATFPLYTRSFALYLTDRSGAVYEAEGLEPVPVVRDSARLLGVCARIAPGLPVYQIGIARALAAKNPLSRDEMQVLGDIAFAEGLSADFRSRLIRAMILHYDWSADAGDGYMLISCGEKAVLDTDTELALTQALISTGLLKEAALHIPRCDYRRLDHAHLKELCAYELSLDAPDVDEYLLERCKYLFDCGEQWDDCVEYLCKYYNGLTADMTQLLHCADAEGLMLFDLPERLLGQMLFTEIYDDLDYVFRCYARDTVNKRLLRAYYVIKCHRYFMLDEELDPEIFEAIKYILAGEISSGDVPVIIPLAVSKYYAMKGNFSEEDRELLRKIIAILSQRGFMFPYFKRFSSFIDLPQEMLDKTIAYYKGREGDSVALVIFPEDDDTEPIYQEMNYVYAGVFIKPILIFVGEHYSYEIRVTRDGKMHVVREGEITANVGDPGRTRRFTRLNALIEGSAVPESRAWQEQMDKYAMDDSMSEMLFKLDW